MTSSRPWRRAGGPAAVQAALQAASEAGRRVLLVYVERAAVRAVREGRGDLLVPAAIAAVVGGLDQNALEALMRMPLIEDAARRLGVDLAEVFERAAGVVGHPGPGGCSAPWRRPPTAAGGRADTDADR